MLSHCLVCSPLAGHALFPAVAGALPPTSVPTNGHLPIALRTDGHLCASRPAGPPALSVQAKCNPCLSSPCQNQGTCHNDPLGFYRCTCPSGYKVPWSWHHRQGTHLCRGEGGSAGALPCPRGSLLAGPSPLSAPRSALPSGTGQGERDMVLWHPSHSHLSLSLGQGLRGGTRWLLLQPLCQRGDLPAPGGGRSWVQVSAGWEHMKNGWLGSSVEPWHPTEIKSGASFPSRVLPGAHSWDIAFTRQLRPVLPALCSPACASCQPSTSRAECWLCFAVSPCPAGSWAERGEGGPAAMGGMGRQRAVGCGVGIWLP